MRIRLANQDDLDGIAEKDRHVTREVLRQKIDKQEVYVAFEGAGLVGWLRYNLFWDNTPFMNMLYVLEGHRGQGIGKALVNYWEENMKRLGYKTLMTSTMQTECAQHFYVKLGYRSIGGFTLEQEPLEILFSKSI